MKVKAKLSFALSKALNMLCCLSKIEKKVVFDSFKGKQYSDNPRAISEKMHELYPDYKIVWVLPKGYDRSKIPEYVEAHDAFSLQYRRERASAIAYVRNEAMTEDMHKRKGQLYIQTWHGDRGIKEILYDSWKDGKRPMKVMDAELTDFFVVGSDYAERRIKTAFRYHGKTIKSGCPRNDCLLNPKDVAGIKQSIHVGQDKKILLYAPTLRIGVDVFKGTLDIRETMEHLNGTGDKWVCLVRAHPKSLGLDLQGGVDVVDVSKYPDMSDLLMIADMLITDYSSSAGDFILRRKPVILAQYDREEYKRGFHVNMESTGYLVAKTQEELNAYIDNLSAEDFAENCEKVMDFFGTCETGHASEDVCRLIDEHYRAANR
ncbi:MAG: CDP-glycerol glycerophosphotransferase family protein [Lachnospiraceae bacterium]|nr:CDP-glycerol glycerophosphotransferase family protein [Lachnospiraceae bacterium]